MKELIPEFFYLPEFLKNSNGLSVNNKEMAILLKLATYCMLHIHDVLLTIIVTMHA